MYFFLHPSTKLEMIPSEGGTLCPIPGMQLRKQQVRCQQTALGKLQSTSGDVLSNDIWCAWGTGGVTLKQIHPYIRKR